MGILQDYLNKNKAQQTPPGLPQMSPPGNLQGLPPQGSGYAQVGNQQVSLADIATKNDPLRQSFTGSGVVPGQEQNSMVIANNLANWQDARSSITNANVMGQQNNNAGMPMGKTLDEFLQSPFARGKDPGALAQLYEQMSGPAVQQAQLQKQLMEPSPYELQDRGFRQSLTLEDIRNKQALNLEGIRGKNAIRAAEAKANSSSGIKLKPGERLTPEGNVELVPGGSAYIKESRLHGRDVAAIKSIETANKNAKAKIDYLLNSPAFSNLFGGYNAYVSSKFPGETQTAKVKLESLKSDLKKAGLDVLRSGGSVGQMTEREWPIVESMIANLDPKMSEEAARDTLQKISAYMDSIKNNASSVYDETWGGTQFYKSRGQSGGQSPGEIDTSIPVNNGKVNGYRQPDGSIVDANGKRLN